MKHTLKIMLALATLALNIQLAQAGGTHIPDGTSHSVCRFGENSNVFTFSKYNELQLVQLIKIPNAGQDGQFLADLVSRGIVQSNMISDQLMISFPAVTLANPKNHKVSWAQNQKIGTRIEYQILSNDLVRLTFNKIAFRVVGECIKERIVEFIPGQPISICAEYATLEPEKTLDQEVVDIELNNCRVQ